MEDKDKRIETTEDIEDFGDLIDSGGPGNSVVSLRNEDASEFADRVSGSEGGKMFRNDELIFVTEIYKDSNTIGEFINTLMENDFSEFKIGVIIEKIYASEIIRKKEEIMEKQYELIEIMGQVIKESNIVLDNVSDKIQRIEDERREGRGKNKRRTPDEIMSMMMLKGVVDITEKEKEKKLSEERRKKAGFKRGS